MNIQKRNGSIAIFDITKIIAAIAGANKEVEQIHQLQTQEIKEIAGKIAAKVSEDTHVETIQDSVEDALLEKGALRWPNL